MAPQDLQLRVNNIQGVKIVDRVCLLGVLLLGVLYLVFCYLVFCYLVFD